MTRQLGWKKDKYGPKDYLYKRIKLGIPDFANWEANTPNVRDQGSLGSCVGFGIGGQITYWAKKLGVFSEWFSPTWIYNGARFIEGGLSEDTGCYPKDALDWLLDKGCLLEHFWPYKDTLDKQAPPSKFDPEAAKWPMFAYYRVTGDVDGICSAISDGNVVSIGTPWYNKWMSTGANGLLAEVNYFSGIAGGHETMLYGYDRTQKVFIGQNSWGTEWGNGGRFLMPFSAVSIFKAHGGYDAHIVKVEWEAVEPQPEPEPEPTPDPTPTPDPEVEVLRKRIEVLEAKLKVAEDRVARHLKD